MTTLVECVRLHQTQEGGRSLHQQALEEGKPYIETQIILTCIQTHTHTNIYIYVFVYTLTHTTHTYLMNI